MRALDELVEKGFIDITHSGSGGIKGDKSLYAISDRWKDYGKSNFKPMKRQKDSRKGRGFALLWEGEKANKAKKKKEEVQERPRRKKYPIVLKREKKK